MMSDRTVTVEVEVDAVPGEAFRMFTEEIDLWWVRGPVNFFDASRSVAMRIEAGVGGRLLEMYDREGSDVRVLGRIIEWNPGSRLAWTCPDGATIQVEFRPLGKSSCVTVRASLPEGAGAESAYWTRVIPPWFGSWGQQRETAPRSATDIARLSAVIPYPDPRSAAQWLCRAFGFTPPASWDDGEHEDPWIEFRIGNAVLTLARGERAPKGSSIKLWVYVDDLEAHFHRAQENGARIVEPITDFGYRSYQTEDLAGHRWIFAQARPSM
jgi:uncharacterized glyoxalase superfamily protein PhnB/uncharacterized protein YndB with AHSA1/START domain